MDTSVARAMPWRFQSAHPELDFLLAQVAEDIQLSPTQYQKAVEHYRAVGEWLAAPGSPLALAKPRIFPQGSMALGTTTSPWGRVEHDVDLVCEVSSGLWTPLTLFDTMYGRLHDHRTFRLLLTPSKPCARLEYRGDFHLDILPAVRDSAGITRTWVADYAGTGLLVPTLDLRQWKASNPEGFIKWFKSRSVTVRLDWLAKAKLEPLPAQTEAEDRAPLAVAVQLMKRARDVAFNGQGLAPRSIVLTTLSGLHYEGGESVTDIMMGVLRGIRAAIRAAGAGIIRVSNPTNLAENFADSMTKAGQDALDRFAQNVGAKLEELQQPGLGIGRLKEELEKLFGEKPVDAAVRKFAGRHKASRDAGTLTYSPSAGLSVIQSSGSHRAPRNTNYGE